MEGTGRLLDRKQPFRGKWKDEKSNSGAGRGPAGRPPSSYGCAQKRQSDRRGMDRGGGNGRISEKMRIYVRFSESVRPI